MRKQKLQDSSTTRTSTTFSRDDPVNYGSKALLVTTYRVCARRGARQGRVGAGGLGGYFAGVAIECGCVWTIPVVVKESLQTEIADPDLPSGSQFCVAASTVCVGDNGMLTGDGDDIWAYNDDGVAWTEGNLAAETFENA
ncbi:hypothetical protein C8J57DRAFT_1254160 [Mycena rebaudengoi]|nr:hypothetical protein C8J57DRAFT_1254160 [Mycena rebaudengoi]